jgi:hypothetical protein
LGCIWEAGFIGALVTDNDCARDTEMGFLGRKDASCVLDMLDNLVNIVEVFPDKPVDVWVFRNGFKAVLCFVVGCWTLYGDVVDKWHGQVWDFRLKDMCEVSLLNLHGTSVAHGYGCESKSASGGLEGCEVSRSRIE